MEFVLTANTTPGAFGKELVSSAEEISRIALEFATKVEDLNILWNVLQKSPEEPSAEFIKAVEVMKQMHHEILPDTVSSCATAVKEVQQVIGKPAGVESVKPGRSGNSGEPNLTDSINCDTGMGLRMAAL